MANLTKTQKKNRNKFIALLVAIVLVLAAIFYVGYSAFMEKSAFLENQDFATALATAFDKAERKVSADDLAAVKFVEFYNDGTNGSIAIGYDDFVTKYNDYMDELEAAKLAEEKGLETELTTEFPSDLAKSGVMETGKDFSSLNDLGYFTGVEVLSLSAVDLDADTLSKFANVKQATFSSCDITDDELAAFAGALNFDNVESITFSGMNFENWAPLEGISDKVTIQSYGIQMDENGQYTVVPSEQTLTEYLAEKAAAEEEAAKAEAEETAEETANENE